MTAVAALAILLVGFIAAGPTRDHAARVIGDAAVAVLDDARLIGEISYHYSWGGVLSLRSLREHADRLEQELHAGHQSLLLGREIELARDAFATATSGALLDAPAMRGPACDLRSALTRVASVADALALVGNDLLSNRADEAALEPLRTRAKALYRELVAAIAAATRAAENLEHRADPQAAQQRADTRKRNAEELEQGRRHAQRAVAEAAASLVNSVDDVVRDQGPWSARAQRIRDARERFAGVVNVETKRMTMSTIEGVREALRSADRAVQEVNAGAQAEQDAKGISPADLDGGAAQRIADRQRLAQEQLVDAQKALEASVKTL